MSIYQQLNEVKIDLMEFEQQPLSSLEKKRIQKKVVKKLKLKKRGNPFGIGAATAVLAIGLLAANHETIANMPFVAGLLEGWNNNRENENWTQYKNIIATTSTTEMGDLTLNEVIINYDRILVSATLQKSAETKFSYRHHLHPTLYIDGQIVEKADASSQSIEQNSEMFMIYNEFKLQKPIEDENISIQLVYETLSTPANKESAPFGEKLEQPWTFDFTASQLAVQQETVVLNVNQSISLANGDSLMIERIVTTPISTTVYYHGADANIVLYDENGQSYYWQSGYRDDDGKGYQHFASASFVNRDLYLQVLSDEEPVSEKIKIPIVQ
ncbi:hypothetical protein [Metasolibacillus meyeri]|uniref:hypothetical protein n=1 Tax=Metasolibacillus meyeri TaxID=1071052 RepID=UPI000D31D456|nr:hypothetical protein [Metasolibacillus meyeri]